MNVFTNFLSRIFASKNIQIKKNNNNAKIPTKEYEDAAGFDIYSSSTYSLNPGERVIVSSGLSMALPKNSFGMITGRSGNTIKKGLFVAPGIIDSDYRGDVGIMCFNLSDSVININTGDKIAQMLILPTSKANIIESQSLNNTSRGDNGFGSTGMVDEVKLKDSKDLDPVLQETVTEPVSIAEEPKKRPRKRKKKE